MGADARHIEQAIEAFVRSRLYAREASKSDHVAVCLLGHPEPVVRYGQNRQWHPVYIRVSKTPVDAAKEFKRAHAVLDVVVHAYVWTATAAHGNRLKAALDAQILGTDPEMVALNGGWRDMPDWETVWPVVLEAALRDLREGGETIETWSNEMRIMRLIRASRERMACPR